MRQTSSLMLSLAVLAACNAAPEAAVIEIGPAAPTTLDDLVGAVVTPAEDPNGDAVTYTWTWTVDGQAAQVVGNVVPASATTKGQVWEATVLAWDESGAASPLSAAVSATIVNSAPTVQVEAELLTPTSEEDLTISVEAADADEDPLDVSITWTRNGTTTSETGETVKASATKKGEVWVATVIANDGEVDSEPATMQFTVENLPPVASAVTLEPTTATETSTLTAKATGTDPDGDTIQWSYTWYVNGAPLPSETSATLSGASFRKGDLVSVEAEPSDGFMKGEAKMSAPVQIRNTAPTLGSVTITPADVDENTVVTCIPAGFSDIDGDPAQHRFAWTVDGKAAGTSPNLTGSDFNKGQRLVCTVTPFDGEADGPAVASTGVVVKNSAPTLDYAFISNSAPRTDDTLALTLGPTGDDDGDKVTPEITWFVASSKAGSGTTLPGSAFSKGQAVYAVVTPFDGTDRGTPFTTPTVNIQNSPPTISAGAISPSTLYTDTKAGLTYTAVDPDSDPVTVGVGWTVNGTSSGAGLTLDGLLSFSKNDRVAAVLTPNDGSAIGTPYTIAAITVRNTAPTAPAIELEPAAPIAGLDDIVCDIMTPATDKDTDTLTYKFTWTKNGTSYTGATKTVWAGDTVPKSATAKDDKFECTALANDGTDDGSSVKASVTVKAPVGEIGSIGAPTLVSSSASGGTTWGAWMVDPKATSGKAYLFHAYYGQTTVTTYPSVSSLSAGTGAATFGVPSGWDGTGHTLHDGIIYYNETNTNNLIRYDIASNKITHRVTLTGAYYRNAAAYQWGGFSDIDLAYDETGLYVIYATPSSSGNIVITKLDPTNLSSLKTWTTTRSKNAGNSWMINGVLYVTASYSASTTTVDYLYDTNTSSGKSASIAFRNDYGYNSMIDYNYGDKKLYAWDNGRLVTYSLTFK